MTKLKELRNISGAPIKQCKQALSASDGEISDAMDWLRIQGIATAQKKATQIAVNGFIASVMDEQQRNASLIEVNCVTEFVEHNELFQQSVVNIANTIALNHTLPAKEQILDDVQQLDVIQFLSELQSSQKISEALTDIMSAIRENLVLRRAYKMRATKNGLICSYLHGRTTANLSLKASLIRLETDSEQELDVNSDVFQSLKKLGNSIATHSVANSVQPKFISISDLDINEIEHERKVLFDQAMEEGTDNLEIAQKKVDGRMKKYFADNALLEQIFCLEDDQKLTVNKLVDNASKDIGLQISVADMVVYNLGA